MNKYFGFLDAKNRWHFLITTFEEKVKEDTYNVYGIEIYPTNGIQNQLYIRTYYDDQCLLQNEHSVINHIFNMRLS